MIILLSPKQLLFVGFVLLLFFLGYLAGKADRESEESDDEKEED